MLKMAHTIRISSFLEVLRLEGHGRIARIDELRGALILLVLIYHLLYDITLFFPAAAPRLWLLGDAIRPLRAVVPGLFILLCGMCTHLSRNNLRRGLWCALFAGGIRLVSGIVSPVCPIRFGILHLLALCLLLWCALHRPLAQMHLPPWAAMVGGGLLFALTYRLEQGYFAGMPLPAALWDREWLLWLGLPWRIIFRCCRGAGCSGPGAGWASGCSRRRILTACGKAAPRGWPGWGGTRWRCICAISRCGLRGCGCCARCMGKLQ